MKKVNECEESEVKWHWNSQTGNTEDGEQEKGLMGRYGWEIGILRCIKSFGAEADLQEIYPRIGDFLRSELREGHLKESYGRQNNYQHQVRSHISNLEQSGHLIKVRRGRYALSPKGLKRANTPDPVTIEI